MQINFNIKQLISACKKKGILPAIANRLWRILNIEAHWLNGNGIDNYLIQHGICRRTEYTTIKGSRLKVLELENGESTAHKNK